VVRELVDKVIVCQKLIGNRERDRRGNWKKSKPWGVIMMRTWYQGILDPNETTAWQNDGFWSLTFDVLEKKYAYMYDTALDLQLKTTLSAGLLPPAPTPAI